MSASLVNSLYVDGRRINEIEHRERGLVLGELQEEWVNMWDP